MRTAKTTVICLMGVIVSSCRASTIDVRIEPREEATAWSSFSSEPEQVKIVTVTIPSSVNLDVPFTPQAPAANWKSPFQEACEEAAAIITDYFYRGSRFSPEIATLEILQLTQWEEAHGYPEDVTVEQLAEIVRAYYGYDARVSDAVTKDSILYELSQGHPVIVPTAGRMLGNPYYSGDGPWYHMLVIRGYDGRYFITNDPGTRRGENYSYTFDTVLAAVHDWTGVKEDIATGPKKMLIVTKHESPPAMIKGKKTLQ